MYMCVKLSPKNLNFGPYSPFLTNTYTCGENKLLISSLYYSIFTQPKSHILVENNPVRVNYAQLS